MPDASKQPLLDALLDSWDRNNTILVNSRPRPRTIQRDDYGVVGTMTRTAHGDCAALS
jgi:hypothetical protein